MCVIVTQSVNHFHDLLLFVATCGCLELVTKSNVDMFVTLLNVLN